MMNPDPSPSALRRALDGVYRATGAMAVACLVMIGVFTLAQVTARLLNTIVPSADDFAGFCMAGAVFLGMTYTLRIGGHVRMLGVLQKLAPPVRRYAELLCALVAALLVAVLLYYTGDMIIMTWKIGERTLGLVPIPKWIPMMTMFIGLLILLIALLDESLRILGGAQPVYAALEETEGVSTADAS